MIKLGFRATQRHNFFCRYCSASVRTFTSQDISPSKSTGSPHFEEPLKEIEFDSAYFSTKALELA